MKLSDNDDISSEQQQQQQQKSLCVSYREYLVNLRRSLSNDWDCVSGIFVSGMCVICINSERKKIIFQNIR